ncbi:quinon protein alcohol dehydrogenase-like superfamily [Zopfochytrium polystomum]|nr:quinon protein alcohol dehydrogenase-like superfamily [Zopfochytrium polystomum]
MQSFLHRTTEYAFQLLLTVSSSTLASVTNRLLPLLRRDFIAALPHELALQIVAYAPDLTTIARITCVSKKWRAVAQDNAIWRTLYLRKGWYINERLLAQTYPVDVPLQRDDTKKSAKLDEDRLYRDRLQLEDNWRNGRYTAREIMGHGDAIYCLQFDEDKIISGSRDHQIKIFSLKTGLCRFTLSGHGASVLCLQYDDRHLISGSSDASVIIWDLQAILRDAPPMGPENSVAASAFNPSPYIVRRLRGHTDSVLNLRFDDTTIITCSKDKTMRIWDRWTGELRATLSEHRAAVNAVQFVGHSIVSASGDRFVKVWKWDRMSGAKVVRTLAGHIRGIACVQYDGNVVVSGSSDSTIRIWDAHTGALINTLGGHADLVRTVQFDSEKIVSGGYDKTIKIWDMRTGALLLDLKASPNLAEMAEVGRMMGGHLNRVFKLQFNEARIVSCSQDQRIIVWDFSEGVDTRFFTRPAAQ